jgi:hypothetical protein
MEVAEWRSQYFDEPRGVALRTPAVLARARGSASPRLHWPAWIAPGAHGHSRTTEAWCGVRGVILCVGGGGGRGERGRGERGEGEMGGGGGEWMLSRTFIIFLSSIFAYEPRITRCTASDAFFTASKRSVSSRSCVPALYNTIVLPSVNSTPRSCRCSFVTSALHTCECKCESEAMRNVA